MKKNRENNINLIYMILFVGFIIISLVITTLIIPEHFNEYARVTNILIWIGMYVICRPLEGVNTIFKSKKAKIKTTLIIVIISYTLYFSLGVFVGYKNTPYSNVWHRLLFNILYIVTLTLLTGYVREKLVNSKKAVSSYILITIIFTLAQLGVNDFIHSLKSSNLLFEYIFGMVLPELIESGVCTYLAITGGVGLIYAYKLPIVIAEVSLPIFPDLDWFIHTGLRIVIMLNIVIYNNYQQRVRERKLSIREIKKINPLKTLPLVIFIVGLLLFIAGFFSYKPIAIISNSMSPTFNRGFVLITKKVNTDYKQIKINDILEYKNDRGIIVHRIVDIKINENNKYEFITKGDNNPEVDTKSVTEEQIEGIVKFKIPYIGYPSVWLSESILSKN